MVTDFLNDMDGDDLIESGDFVTGPSDDNHNELVMIAYPGLIRCSPITGVALFSKMKSRLSLKAADTLKQEAILQLQVDGVINPGVTINSIIDLTVTGER